MDVPNDTIFVSGFPEETTEAQLAEHFGQIGIIKTDRKNQCPKIWIYKDKTTGRGKGEATITYDDPPTATSAISWFSGKEFNGSTITVDLAQRKSAPPQYNRDRDGGGGGGFGGKRRFTEDSGYRNNLHRHKKGRDDRGSGQQGDSGRGSGGSGGRPGDWVCPSCKNNNFAYRRECNRCRTKKSVTRRI